MFAEDEAVMRDTDREKRWPWAILDAQKEMLTRPMPNIFTVHKVREVELVLGGGGGARERAHAAFVIPVGVFPGSVLRTYANNTAQTKCTAIRKISAMAREGP